MIIGKNGISSNFFNAILLPIVGKSAKANIVINTIESEPFSLKLRYHPEIKRQKIEEISNPSTGEKI